MKPLRRVRRKLRDTHMYWKIFSDADMSKAYEVMKLDEEHFEELATAKKLHAAVYLSRAFITHDDLMDDIIHETSDPHQRHADYFVVKRNGRIVAAARQIIYRGEGELHKSFPVLEKSLIHMRSRNRIMAFQPEEIVEISALVKAGGESSIVPLLLYRALWRHSLKSRHRIWVMACDIRLYQRLKLLFGPSLTKIGQRTPYVGGDVIPVALDIANASRHVAKVSHVKRTGYFNVQHMAAKFIVKGESS